MAARSASALSSRTENGLRHLAAPEPLSWLSPSSVDADQTLDRIEGILWDDLLREQLIDRLVGTAGDDLLGADIADLGQLLEIRYAHAVDIDELGHSGWGSCLGGCGRGRGGCGRRHGRLGLDLRRGYGRGRGGRRADLLHRLGGQNRLGRGVGRLGGGRGHGRRGRGRRWFHFLGVRRGAEGKNESNGGHRGFHRSGIHGSSALTGAQDG